MLWFWVAAAMLSGVLAALVLHRAARATQAAGQPDPEVEVYRRQLAEIEDLASRGLLASEQVKSARAETGRRLITAAERPPPAVSGRMSRAGVLAAALAAPAIALALYAGFGRPGLPDQPIDERLRQWRSADPETLGPSEMAAVLSQAARERPNDPQALMFLARAQAMSGQTLGALRTLRQAARRWPENAEIYALAGEIQAMAASGDLPESARQAFARALQLDPKNMVSRYVLGQDLIRRGSKAEGLALWRELLTDLDASDPRRSRLVREIAQAEAATARP
jgi:cytochrome c-type biogenesis protein CcmH